MSGLPDKDTVDVRVTGGGECTMVRRGSLQNVFSGCICSRVRMIHGGGSIVVSFLYPSYGSKQTNGGMHEGRSAGAGGDGMIKMICLYLIGERQLVRSSQGTKCCCCMFVLWLRGPKGEVIDKYTTPHT